MHILEIKSNKAVQKEICKATAGISDELGPFWMVLIVSRNSLSHLMSSRHGNFMKQLQQTFPSSTITTTQHDMLIEKRHSTVPILIKNSSFDKFCSTIEVLMNAFNTGEGCEDYKPREWAFMVPKGHIPLLEKTPCERVLFRIGPVDILTNARIETVFGPPVSTVNFMVSPIVYLRLIGDVLITEWELDEGMDNLQTQLGRGLIPVQPYWPDEFKITNRMMVEYTYNNNEHEKLGTLSNRFLNNPMQRLTIRCLEKQTAEKQREVEETRALLKVKELSSIEQKSTRDQDIYFGRKIKQELQKLRRIDREIEILNRAADGEEIPEREPTPEPTSELQITEIIDEQQAIDWYDDATKTDNNTLPKPIAPEVKPPEAAAPKVEPQPIPGGIQQHAHIYMPKDIKDHLMADPWDYLSHLAFGHPMKKKV